MKIINKNSIASPKERALSAGYDATGPISRVPGDDIKYMEIARYWLLDVGFTEGCFSTYKSMPKLKYEGSY